MGLLWAVLAKSSMTTVARACPYFKLKAFRKEEGVQQMGAFYMSFHMDNELGVAMSKGLERLIVAEGGKFMPGPAPRGPLDREISALIGNDRK